LSEPLRVFFDSNVPLYLLSDDAEKASRAEELLSTGGIISVQVLNEVVAVARRTRAKAWPAIQDTLDALKAVCSVEPLTLAVQEKAVELARRFDFHVYDATIVASALAAGCSTLYTEDLQHGQVIEGMTIHNPFA
jgi:predicted nucleic acid-binding protein